MPSSSMRRSLLLLAVAAATAQAQTLTCLTTGKTTSQPVPTIIDGIGTVTDAELRQENLWTVQGKTNHYTVVAPVEVAPVPNNPGSREVNLTTYPPVDMADGPIRISFRGSKVMQGDCTKASSMPDSWIPTLTSDAKNADVTLTGALQSAVGSKPLYNYTIDAKYAIAPRSAVRWAFGTAFKAVASQQTNADPDSMKLSGTFRYDLPLAWTDGIIINSDLIGYEFSRTLKGDAANQSIEKNSNRMHSAYATLVRSGRMGTFDFRFAGIEAGQAISRTVKANSRGETESNILRGVFGVDYFNYWTSKSVKRIDFEFHHTQRVLAFAEPYKRAGVNNGKQFLTQRARPVTTAKLTFTVMDGIGISASYYRGSAPPTYQFVDHQLTVGLTVTLKRQ